MSPIVCSGQAFNVRISPQLDERFKPPLEEAFKTWESKLNGAVRFSVEIDPQTRAHFDACVVQVYFDESDDTQATMAHREDPTTGRLYAAALIIRSVKHVNEPDFLLSLFTHEVGHAVGLEHDYSLDHESIMWPFISESAKLGCEDVRRACLIWGCMPTCQGNGWAE